MGFGVDTLHLFFRAPLAGTTLRQLLELQKVAKEAAGGPLPRYELGGQVFEVRPNGGLGADLLLLNEAFAVKLAAVPLPGMPTIMVEVRAVWLWQRGADQAVDDARKIALDLTPDATPIHPAALEPHVTRLDLCCDFQGWVPQLDELMPQWGDKQDKNAPGLKCQANWSRPHLEAKSGCTGIDYGKKSSEVSAGIYDKTREIAEASNKDWFEQVWQGFAGTDYHPEEAVWRLEYRLRREGITGFQLVGPAGGGTSEKDLEAEGKPRRMETWRDVRAALGGLWRYLTGRWLSRRAPRTKKSRQVLEPGWKVFHELDTKLLHHGETHVLRRRLVKVAHDATAQLRGYAALFLALVRWHGHDKTLGWEVVSPWMLDEVKAYDEAAAARGKPSLALKAAEHLAAWSGLQPDHWDGRVELGDFESIEPGRWKEAGADGFKRKPKSGDEMVARLDRLVWAHQHDAARRARGTG